MAKTCTPDKILNPSTQKCVAIKGSVGKALVAKHKAGEVQLSDDNVKKLSNAGLLGVAPTKTTVKKVVKKKTVSEKKTSPKIDGPPPQISEHMQKKIHAFVTEWKKRQAQKFADEGHQLYCKTSNLNDLGRPIVNMNVTINFPVQCMKGAIEHGGFDIHSLNAAKPTFALKSFSGANFMLNNLSIRNILYKNPHGDLAYFETLIDFKWLKDMNDYMTSLTTKQIYTIIGYTHFGDTVANNYMRRSLNKQRFTIDLASYERWGPVYFPLFFQAIEFLEESNDVTKLLKDGKDADVEIQGLVFNQPLADASFVGTKKVSEILTNMKSKKNLKFSDKYLILYKVSRFLSFSEFWQPVIRNYIRDLDGIIDNAPAVRTPTIVYRGVKDDYFLKGRDGHVYRNNSFSSTSLNMGAALRFANSKCCFKRITLLPGTKVLLIAGVSKYKNEIEILLGSKAQFYITKEKTHIPRDTTKMCKPTTAESIQVTDIVVIK